MTDADRPPARAPLAGVPGVDLYRVDRATAAANVDVSGLPVTIKVLLENLLRHADGSWVASGDIEALARWSPGASGGDAERAFMPARVLLQDFTGVPSVVDLAAMRDAMARAGGDAGRIDPLVPVDLVVDHSVQVDRFGDGDAYAANIAREYERNRERYELLRWAQQAFHGFRVVPPGMGIVHQVNLEYLASVVTVRDGVAFPDTLVGTDSHTTMVNGIGVLGWGVGGIEAEAVMLGQPAFLLTPVVVGVRFHNALAQGVTATDLVLTLTEMLRRHGVVNKFVEFCGAGLSSMTAADRATLSNMSPEYGATAALFPVDVQTLRYLRESGRAEEHIDLVERYTREQGMFRTDESETPRFSELLELDLATVEPSLSGPRRPQDRVPLRGVRESFDAAFARGAGGGGRGNGDIGRFVGEGGGQTAATQAAAPTPTPARCAHAGGDGDHTVHPPGLDDGSVVIAAITSCTNTSNPSVMIGAGLLARNAVARGLRVAGHVKTSMAPGSRVVTEYLRRAGLLEPLSALHFDLVGYGCTTCIGNSGPLPDDVAEHVTDDDLAVAAVLSGNRNFEGRIHPQVRAAYLASPPLVVAYALAGTVTRDLTTEPLGTGADGAPVHLRDIWPTNEEIAATVRLATGSDLYGEEYARIFDGDDNWRGLPAPTGAMFAWEDRSTYVRRPPFFVDMAADPGEPADVAGARCLAVLGDSVTTDHISPAGTISRTSPAAAYLRESGVEDRDFNTYGSRRGNHEVMMRGTFANIRLRNALAGGREGGWTEHLPSGEVLSIYDAAMRYQADGTPLVVLAGKEYGSGSSRDWAAKGTALLGVRAVIAESYERIHRSNLIGMGVLPLQFPAGANAESLRLTGEETVSISGVEALNAAATPSTVHVTAGSVEFDAVVRIDTPGEADYYRHGGIMQFVLRSLL
ncbi:MAG TPA: aconitate hydratase AcnA [Candidatus Dormibacteraeota bacterium]|nr:aconitate hydratase AcnA [Candidatus Dormibacteraeota bacterium]